MGGVSFSQTKIRNLLSRSRKDPYVAVRNRDFVRSRKLCLLFFDQCDDETFFNPRGALERGYIARKVGKESRDVHLLTRGTGLLGSAYRIKRLDDDARMALDEALELADECACCLADVYRRHGIFYLWQKEYEKAYDFLCRSVMMHEKLDDPDGIGRTLISRGATLSWMGRTDEGLKDFERSISLLSATSPQCFHISAVINIALALVHGRASSEKMTQARYSRALGIVEAMEKRLAGKTEAVRVRPSLRWIKGLLCANTGERRRAFDFLRAARRGHIRLGLHREALVVSADLACLYKAEDEERNDDQVIELAEFCLERLDPNEAEKGVLIKLIREPTGEIVRQFRTVVPCVMPSLI